MKTFEVANNDEENFKKQFFDYIGRHGIQKFVADLALLVSTGRDIRTLKVDPDKEEFNFDKLTEEERVTLDRLFS